MDDINSAYTPQHSLFDFGVRYTTRIMGKSTTWRVTANKRHQRALLVDTRSRQHHWAEHRQLSRALGRTEIDHCIHAVHFLIMRVLLLTLFVASAAAAQTANCVPPTNQQLIIFRAGSLTRAFTPLEQIFACQTGIQVKDTAMGSVDAGRQITAGGQACDLYAPADYLDIDLFMKPASYANFNIVFAHGRMVLAYSANGLAAKKLPPIADPANPTKATAKWYEILTMDGVAIGSGNPFLDPGAYRGLMVFQLAEAYYKVPNLYNNLLGHMVILGADPTGTALGTRFDFQFTYEHNAVRRERQSDYRYVDLPDDINLSDPARDAYYRQNAVVVLPGLGTSRSARTIAGSG
jgi:molybdate/tungstate transport system substrate-binding protein